MQCPVCDGPTKVIDSRDTRSAAEIRRRRGCQQCGHRFTTYERIDEALPQVVKRSGERQPFDSAKILRGLQLACRKRPIGDPQLASIVRAVEQWASTRGERGVSSEALGEQIMHYLYALDQVAYVRFVSVYRSFESVEEFEQLLREMEKAERVNVEGQRTLFEGMAAPPILPGVPRPPRSRDG